MLEDMVQIKIAVEGMKAEIIKCFDAKQISAAIESATQKAVDAFDMESFIARTVEGVLNQAREQVMAQLSQKYGSQWAVELEVLIDKKIGQALSEG